MEPRVDNQSAEVNEKSVLHQVTPVSKYLAMALFISLPFVGGYVGYSLAPEKVVEVTVERVVVKDISPEQETETKVQPVSATTTQEVYKSPNGFSVLISTDSVVTEEPAQLSISSSTRISGDFGSVCISPGYGCGGVGMQGWTQTRENLVTGSGNQIALNVWREEDGGDRVMINMTTLAPLPNGFSTQAQIQLETTESKLEQALAMLVSLKFTD